jgi:peptide/nickel transport system substrate-binding protein
MQRRRIMGLAALGAAAALALAACGGGSSSTSGGGGGPSGPTGFNAAVTGVVNPSSTKSTGTLTFGESSTPDSTDPGNTYYAHMWNFTRLYAMPLMTYGACPGQCGQKVVPNLATAPGTVSDNGLTWTYHIKPNVKFEDGTTVTSSDVKYAVERTYDRSVLPLGPAYFPLLLAPQKPAYPGPFKPKLL